MTLFKKSVRFAQFACLLLGCAARADLITDTLAITNTPANGATIANGADVRTWTTGAVTSPSTQIAIAANNILNASNLFYAIASARFTGMTATWDGVSSNVVFFGGAPLAITLSAGYATNHYFTNSTTPALVVSVPFNAYAATSQVQMASQLVTGIDANTTTAFGASSPALVNHLGLSTVQTVTGAKAFTGALVLSNAANLIVGGVLSNNVVSNSPAISGNVNALTNGYWLNGVLTNGQNFGNPFRSPGTGAGSEQFGLGAAASGIGATAFGDGGAATGTGATEFGDGGNAGAGGATAIGLAATVTATGGTAIGNNTTVGFASGTALGVLATTTTAHQVMLGTASEYVEVDGSLWVQGNVTNLNTTGTNKLAGLVSFPRLNITSAVNGNNTIDPGTNTYIKVSGPSAGFTIASMKGGVDGRILMIENATGQTMTIANNSGFDGTAANHIFTGTGADVADTSNPGVVSLLYDSAAGNWVIWSVH